MDMKKLAVIFTLTLLFSFNVYADVCVDVSEYIATKAVNILKKQKEIYDYCSICEDAKPQTISIKNIAQGKKVYVNGAVIDLAHTYFKQDNKYINLGIASGCIKDGQYGIAAQLDNLTEFHHTKEAYKEQAEQQAKAVFDKCINKLENNKYKTTQDMIERNIAINNCLVDAIKQEIQNGFNPQQQIQVLKNFEQARKSIWTFYNDIYAANKYCYGQCGSITSLLPYSDEGYILMQMLERLLYLNIAKKGY